MKPNGDRLFSALDATWPAAGIVEREGWRLRRGEGGGRRVSAATRPPGATGEPDIAVAEAAMEGWGQRPLFMLRDGDGAMDATLAAAGYDKVDETSFYLIEAAALLDDQSETARIIRGAGPIAMIEEIWAKGGVGPERLAVMARAAGPKSYMIGRLADRPVSVAFVAVDGDIAMVHALETLERARRRGAARMLLSGAARFAQENGARWLALAVTDRNVAASALYRGLGMTVAGRYHYRERMK